MSSEQLALYQARQRKESQPPLMTKAYDARSEALVHDAILSECRRHGLCVIHSRMDRASTVAVGAPDFVIALPAARTLWLECKSATGILREEQAVWLANLQDLGHEAHLIRSIDEFLSVLTT